MREMKNNKFIIKIALIATLALPTINSCSDADFLDKKPLGVAAEGDLAAGGFEELAFGLYGKLRTQEGIADWHRYWFQSIRSDDAAKGSNSTDAPIWGNAMENFQYSPNEFAANWNGHFGLIFACNDLVVAVEESGATDQGSLTNAAEAKVIRAFAYFDLRRDYGEVPIILKKIVTPSDGVKAKNTVAEVDAQIISDLEYAALHLPLSWPAYPGRATKGFANSLLAKLYLYQGDWKKALAKSEEVINSGQYNLMSSYETLFTKAGNNSRETVFEVQFLVVGRNYYSNNYFESQGVRGTGAWDLGWGFNVPTTNLINAYEANDPRKAATILYSGQSDGIGIGSILPASPPLDQLYWNKKAYTLPDERKDFGENKNHWENVKIMRYADVLLIAAEAANEDGNSGLAATYLEQVRKRARGANNAILPIRSGGQSTMRTYIKQERRIEFAMEGERFYDLVRWGDAGATLGGKGYQTKHQYYPIPQIAINESGGVLKQNPNY